MLLRLLFFSLGIGLLAFFFVGFDDFDVDQTRHQDTEKMVKALEISNRNESVAVSKRPVPLAVKSNRVSSKPTPQLSSPVPKTTPVSQEMPLESESEESNQALIDLLPNIDFRTGFPTGINSDYPGRGCPWLDCQPNRQALLVGAQYWTSVEFESSWGVGSFDKKSPFLLIK